MSYVSSVSSINAKVISASRPAHRHPAFVSTLGGFTFAILSRQGMARESSRWIPNEVIKKTRINLLMPLSPYRFFSSLSFCRLSALITIKEVYAHAAAIQKIIRSMKAA
jgi:hypothetical protein